MKRVMSFLLLCGLLLTGCAAGDDVPETQPATVPVETAEPTVSAPDVEIAATEATLAQ